MDVDRVLMWPTEGVVDFLRKGKALDPTPCCSLYVAVTRARASVAFVVERPDKFSLPTWKPT
jgi:ATP-dependent DNA helicase UvrD/PcrA